jgi:hypothetical protein
VSSTNGYGLRDKIREAIKTGKLPGQHPVRTWGGRGSGEPCAICGELIRPNESELEVEYGGAGNGGRNGNGNGHTNLHLHVGCCSAWEAERRALSAAQPRGEPAAVLFTAEQRGNMRSCEGETT